MGWKLENAWAFSFARNVYDVAIFLDQVVGRMYGQRFRLRVSSLHAATPTHPCPMRRDCGAGRFLALGVCFLFGIRLLW